MKPTESKIKAAFDFKTPFAMTATMQAIADGNSINIIKTHYHFEAELRELRCLTRGLAEMVANPPDGHIQADELEGLATATAVYADLITAHLNAFLDALQDQGRLGTL